MPSTLTCSCGRVLRVKDGLAGKKARCPACSAIIVIPVDEPANVDPVNVEDAASGLLLDDSAEERGVRPISRDPEHDDPVDRPLYKPPAREGRPEVKRPRLDRDRRPSGPRVAFEPGWFGSSNAGMVGGVLMMVIAVVWFFVGLAAGWIFIYPPILFVVGIVAFVKGLVSRR